MKEDYNNEQLLSYNMKKLDITLVLGIAFAVFGIVQFSSIASNPVIIENIIAQGYSGLNIYYAPQFVSSYVLFIVGALLLLASNFLKRG